MMDLEDVMHLRFGEVLRKRSSRALGCTALALIPGCGFVGFEARTVPEDAGAGEVSPPRMDGGESDAASSDDAGNVDPSDGRDAGSNIDAAMLADTGIELDDAGPDAFVDPDPPATQVSNYCTSIPRLQREPVIDGVVDSKLNVVSVDPQGWTSKENVPLPDHNSASYAFAWRDDGLYAYIRVVDGTRLPPKADSFIWEGDGVEIYFDTDGLFVAAPTYDNPGAIQIIVTAPEDGSSPSTKSMRFRNAAEQGAWSSARFAAFPTADGYVLEGFLEGDTVDVPDMTLSAGQLVGIDVGINVSVLDEAGLTADDRRLGQFFLSITSSQSGCAGGPYCTPAAFCTPSLVE